MTWSLFRWIWEVEGPVHIGIAPAGSLNRCRLYVPARALWGALTAELARHEAENSDPKYRAVGERLRSDARFSYLYPAEFDGREWRAWLPSYQEGQGLVWKREDRGDKDGLSDRRMRIRLVSTRAATAIDPESDTAAEGSLRETECINTHWRNEDGTPAGPVALKGYVFIREGSELNLANLEGMTIGGDARYGLGRLRRIGDMNSESQIFRMDVRLEAKQPVVATAILLAHGRVNAQPDDNNNNGGGNASAAIIDGDQEAIGGWDYDRSVIQRIAGPLWSPGSKTQSRQKWDITDEGTWSLSLESMSSYCGSVASSRR